MKDLIIVIPVLSKNRHFKDGDLKQISGISLVQWKINQMPTLIESYPTYVYALEKIDLSSNDDKVRFIQRKDESVGSMIAQLKSMFSKKPVLWVNCNAPFVNEKTMIDAISEFEAKKDKYTGLVPVIEDKNFFIYNGGPLNFSLTDELSRINNRPLIKVTNSFYMFELDSVQSNLITENSLYYNVSKGDSFELDSDSSENDIKNKFIEYLMSKNNN